MSSAAAARISSDNETATSSTTLAGLCLEALRRHNKPDAVSEKRDGQWIHVPGATFGRRVRHIALGLADLGIDRKSVV